MPAESKAQRQLFAIAEHKPGELYARNKSLAALPQKTLHDFAATKEKGLPERVKKTKRKGPTAPLSNALQARRR